MHQTNPDLDRTAMIPIVLPSALDLPPLQPSPVRPATLPNGHPVAINCPECGAAGSVDPTRRDAGDFCAHCDFPLFWAKDRVSIGEPSEAGEDALRRLPGALGRVVIASVPCPHCNELNLPTATYCVRCGLSMQLLPAPPPPPAPVVLPAPTPPPPPRPEPERMWIWWVLLITVFVLAAAGLIWAQHWYWWR